MKRIESSVTPEGTFRYGIHKPGYRVTNFREETREDTLGLDRQGNNVLNTRNYPDGDVNVEGADWIFEIPNPLPFKGRTFIDKEWADGSASNYDRIRIPQPEAVSLYSLLEQQNIAPDFIEKLPAPLLLSLATTSTDAKDLVLLAKHCCEFVDRKDGTLGLLYDHDKRGLSRAAINDHLLFEAVANNPYLPNEYKIAMVIRPGAQGGSEIVGDWPRDGESHVYEYLRRNSYIAGGHYAANMADDAIRYSIADLSRHDMQGLRHLYYQRTYARLAEDLRIPLPGKKKKVSEEELEALRREIVERIGKQSDHPATLWGWNFGFDYAPTRYRLHASHQQVHQQYAMVPDQVAAYRHGTKEVCGKMSAYCCGDLVNEVISRYREQHNSEFFTDYQQAIYNNRRMDDRSDLSAELIVYQDENVMVFVPKAQTSQWEMQIMTRIDSEGKCAGNILECDTAQRNSLDTALYKAQKALAGLGAKMVTSIEYSKRIGAKEQCTQPLLYALLPRLPESPGAFSEAQLRFINGHYPEDFAAVCRAQL